MGCGSVGFVGGSVGLVSGGSVTFGGSVCFGVSVTLGVWVCFGDSVSAGLAVSGLPLSAGAVLLSFSFSVVNPVVLSVPAGRLLSAVGSAVLSVTVAVMPLSVLAGSLPVFSVLSVPHPARQSVNDAVLGAYREALEEAEDELPDEDESPAQKM